MKKIYLLPLLIIPLLIACNSAPTAQEKNVDPLPSWNEGTVKASIMQFVASVTDESGPDFIEIPDRIAVFDNDGTLWAEKPLYFQLFFAIDRVKALAGEHPEWQNEQPFKAVIENDMATLSTFGTPEILKIVMVTHAGMTSDEFEQSVKDWISTARHPVTDKLFTEMVYQPMLELLDYLQENDFKTFIVSGGGIDFMRPWTEEVYGISKDQVVGSSIKTEFVLKDDQPQIIRLPEINFIDDKEGKPVGINRYIGRKPVFCAGNSDGDLQMMQWTASGSGKRMMLYLHHTDPDREWAYDRQSSVGHFDKGLDEATDKGWTIISMKDDWKTVFPD